MEDPEAVFVKTENTSGDPPLWVSSFHEQGDIDKLENSGEEYDSVCLQKKRRLNPEQVQFLEKSFELENKLEPERKSQLAKEVGLQPRQVAIWFQNRRARYKTKLLEKDYSSLKSSYEKLKSDYGNLLKENQEIRNEIKALTEKMGVTPAKEEKSDQIFSPEKAAAAAMANSDVLDSDSVYCPESEYSQEEEDVPLCKILLHHPFFPKLEFESNDDLQPNCCNLGFPVQNQGTWFWHY